MSAAWFKIMKRDNPTLAYWYHGLCKVNVAIKLPCSEDDVEAVISGNGHDVKEAEKIPELYWSEMKKIMSDHEHRELFRERI